MLSKCFKIDAWIVVKTLEEANGREFAEVVVADFVFCKQGEVKGDRETGNFFLFKARCGCKIELTADDGLDFYFFALFVKIDSAIKVTVVGEGAGGHAEPSRFFCEIFNR